MSTKLGYGRNDDDSLVEIPLIGRDKELNRCRELLKKANNGNGSTIIVSGQAGIGKTRFIKELLDEAINAGMVVHESRCHQNVSTNFGPFLGIMKQLESGSQITTSGSGENDDSRIIKIRDKILDSLISEARSIPVLFVMEDIHWGDSSSINLVYQLARRIRYHPIIFLTSYREEELEAQIAQGNCPFYDVLRVSRQHGVIEIKLNPLDNVSIQNLIEHFLRDRVDLGLIEKMQMEGGGNPLYILEMLKWMRQANVIYYGSMGWSIDRFSGYDVPKAIEEVIGMGMANLPKPHQDLIGMLYHSWPVLLYEDSEGFPGIGRDVGP